VTSKFKSSAASPLEPQEGWERGSIFVNDINDEVVLGARLFLATLFLIFGWRKLRDYSGTVRQMVKVGVPMPVPATAVAIFMEPSVAFAVAIGAFTSPSAVLLGFYMPEAALIGHDSTITGADQLARMEGFYKNLSIMGGSAAAGSRRGTNPIRQLRDWLLCLASGEHWLPRWSRARAIQSGGSFSARVSLAPKRTWIFTTSATAIRNARPNATPDEAARFLQNAQPIEMTARLSWTETVSHRVWRG
jgi:putative oxidoreductase